MDAVQIVISSFLQLEVVEELKKTKKNNQDSIMEIERLRVKEKLLRLPQHEKHCETTNVDLQKCNININIIYRANMQHINVVTISIYLFMVHVCPFKA